MLPSGGVSRFVEKNFCKAATPAHALFSKRNLKTKVISLAQR
jgi:hypothetical protein